jgi:hypothetical protein
MRGRHAGLVHHSRRINMKTTVMPLLRKSLTVAATVALLGCAEEAPLAVEQQDALSAQLANAQGEQARVFATLRRVTARYHNVDAAIADGFIQVHPCEGREGEGPVGLLYANMARVADGIIDPESPEGLIYEPGQDGSLKLVGVEFAVPYQMPRQPPPQFLGATFQPEDEFQVFGLHVWVWRHNPEGMLAVTNPNVTCDAA